ncbi:hypothetical protein ACRE_063660 [Hapsidospora chrysogenum ATCC 11550]|uniref:Uncharacterized protein n=1 Tax=Hapsidospora chrysogenum (strain ATCC 11550 / CBS 779.69 / DSM 880 / IAM 14645 / JCM 23072 / IMI 49137) TaxID=857340 RepID=A0A086T0N2_HAPC1|nr:hypothetical protein ACRE_063660 [Hapsidospora chrysogenum ATCC 11550]
MAPLGQKLLSVFGLLAASLSSLGLAGIIDRDLAYSTDLLNVLPRAPTTKLDWPCLPDKRRPRKEAKDPGAKVGVLPYTAAIIAAGNENHVPGGIGTNGTIAARHASKYHESRALAKRLGGAISTLYNEAVVQVPTDGGYIIYWQTYLNDPEDLIIATRDLSGCTVVVVCSPHVALMAHVWERRDDDTWLLDPLGPAQTAEDAEFVVAASTLMDSLLGVLGGNALNGYGGWLPRESTTVHVIAPASNPDYDDDLNPWYAAQVPQNLIYPNQAPALVSMVTAKVGCADRGEILTYRRRYSNDPDHGTDDRDKVVLAPYILQGHTYVNLMWDDDQLKPIVQIN